MPFSSLSDPVDLARAAAALEAAWQQIRAIDPDVAELEHVRLAYIVAGLVPVDLDEDELTARALEQYRHAEPGIAGVRCSTE